jgi:hypothetical protein
MGCTSTIKLSKIAIEITTTTTTTTTKNSVVFYLLCSIIYVSQNVSLFSLFYKMWRTTTMKCQL